MLTVASLLAAMTIAGAFWVGVLAARRLRDWGEGRRAIDEGHAPPLALAAASGAPPDDASTRRVRDLVAERLSNPRARPGEVAPRQLASADRGARDTDLGLGTLRQGDVVVVEAADGGADGDYIVEGIVLLREGNHTTTSVNMSDGSRHRWLVGGAHLDEWFVLEPVAAHGLSGEPPRNIRRERSDYTLQRRGQASAACTGRHERPEQPRVATYLYGGSAHNVLWLERWGHEVLMAEGIRLDAGSVSFLPGS